MPLTFLRRKHASPFTPARFAPLIWLTPDPAYCFTDDGVTQASNRQSIKQWNNRGSLGGFFTQATAGLRPTLVLVGGKYSVRATSASGHQMSSSGIDMSAVAGATLSLLAKKGAGQSDDAGGYA